MARDALKMARERLVANVKGGKFGPRAIFFRFAPPPVKSLFGDSVDSFETTNGGPPSFGNVFIIWEAPI